MLELSKLERGQTAGASTVSAFVIEVAEFFSVTKSTQCQTYLEMTVIRGKLYQFYKCGRKCALWKHNRLS